MFASFARVRRVVSTGFMNFVRKRECISIPYLLCRNGGVRLCAAEYFPALHFDELPCNPEEFRS